MIEARVYRAAFIPALLVLVLAMFSFGSRPRPLPQGLAADVLFDGEQAAELAERIAAEQPDRRAGGRGDAATADLVAGSLESRGFRVSRQRFSRAGRELENVVGRRLGASRRQIVIVAARDSIRVPDAPGSAADTAALLELARVFQGRPSRKTLVLASVDGSDLGELGSERLTDLIGSPAFVDGVLVMSDLGSAHATPSAQIWSSNSRRVGIALQRTIAESIRQEAGRVAGGPGAIGQLLRLSFPVGIGAQGPLIADGYDAVRVSGSGELPPPGNGPLERLDADRLGALGRATLRAVTALDRAGRPDHGPASYVLVVSQVLPGWVISLFAGTLLLPVLVASVDALARARRRGLAVLRWLRWLAAWVAPFLAGLAAAQLLVLAGATPTPPAAPVAPGLLPLDGPALAVMGGVLGAMLLAFLLARWLAARPDPALRDPEHPPAAVALVLGLSLAVLGLWLLDPYAGLLLVPAAHLWMLAVLPARLPRRRVRLAMVAAGLLLPLLVAVYYLFALSLDPLAGAWYLFLLVTGHSVDLPTALAGCLLLGVACATLELAWRTPGVAQTATEQSGPSIFGPGPPALTRVRIR